MGVVDSTVAVVAVAYCLEEADVEEAAPWMPALEDGIVFPFGVLLG